MLDPPRPETPAAVALCQSSGITAVMITGDHPATAKAIAMRIGIASDKDQVITGRALDKMTDAEFFNRVKDIKLYARVTPEQKIRIVDALIQQQEYVAMTGDGVNDAPALKRAHIGVAMGQKGTDVAREASALVLQDDNFSTIVSAIREGRRIYDNILKFIKYTLTSNTGEIVTLAVAPFFGMPLPLLPVQILWVNLVTDGLPGLALSVEPAEKNIMQRSPRPPQESVFANGLWQHTLIVGLLIGAVSLFAQYWAITQGSSSWQTVVFTTLTFAQLMHILAIRSSSRSAFSRDFFANPKLLLVVLLTVLLQLMVIYLPFFNTLLKTSPISITELGLCVLLAGLIFVAVEIEKWLINRGILYRRSNSA